MNIKFVGIVCSLMVIGTLAYVHAQPNVSTSQSLPVGSNGRYQVISTDIDIASIAGDLKYKTPVRIDTQTGQAWVVSAAKDPKTGAIDLVWKKLEESKKGSVAP
jgi:hypothetical protein